MLILWPSPDAENRKTLQISCCCWNLTHTEGYLHQITQKPLLSVANGALHDWESPGAPQSCSPDLQSTCTQASQAAWLRLLPHLAWFTANKLTKLSLKVSWITKLWTVCKTRRSSVIAAEVSQIELLRLTAVENIREVFSHRSIGNISAYLLGNCRHYVGAWQTVHLGPDQRTESKCWQGLQGSISASHIRRVNELKEWSS